MSPRENGGFFFDQYLMAGIVNASVDLRLRNGTTTLKKNAGNTGTQLNQL